MKKRFLLAAVIAVLAFCQGVAAKDFTCLELKPGDGFPSKVNSIYVQPFGYSFLAAEDGLYIYSGISSLTKISSSDTGGNRMVLPGSRVMQVSPGADGVVWVLTNRGFLGFCPDKGPQYAINGPVTAYSAVSVGDCTYFGCDDCVWKYDHKKGEFSILVELNSEIPFRIDKITAHEGPSGPSLVLFNASGQKQKVYNIGTGNIRESVVDDWKEGFFTAFADIDGTLWLSEYDGGVYRYTADGQLLAHFSMENSAMTSNSVLCFAERDSKIWMGTSGGGINILDPGTGEVEVLKYLPGTNNSIPASTITSLFCDAKGRMWCGRAKGGAFVVSYTGIDFFATSEIHPGIDPDGFTCLLQVPSDNRIWIGTAGSGLMCFDPSTRKFTLCSVTHGLNIYTMVNIGGGRIFLSCPNSGFYVFDTATLSISRPGEFTDRSNYFYSGAEGASVDVDEHGHVVAFSSDIKSWDPVLGTVKTFPADLSQLTGFMHAVTGAGCRYFVDDTHVYEWGDTEHNSLRSLYETENGALIRSAVVGPSGHIWLAIGNDICRFNPTSGDVTFSNLAFETKPMSLFCDRMGRVWIGTRNRLYIYNPSVDSFSTLGEADGVYPNEYSPHAKLAAANGDIYLAGKNGLVHIHNDYQSPWSPTPEIVPSYFDVDGEFSEVKENFRIPYSHKYVELGLGVRSQDVLESRSFRVHVSAVGYSWDETVDSPKLRWYRLEPGRYSVYVSCTASGHWSDSVKICSFRVTQPWYRQIWFHILLFLFVVALLLTVYFETVRFMKSWKEHVSRKERYNFLVNLSHEMRTPLALIQGPVASMSRSASITGKDKESLGIIRRQTRGMLGLLDTVITSCDLDAGSIKVYKSSVYLQPWLEQCAAEFEEEATRRNMTIMIKADPEYKYVRMDENLCHIVLSNFISNSLKHNLPGHHITIWTGINLENGKVRIGTRDHGTGLGDIDVNAYFERYFKVTEDKAGFGVGIFYSKAIMKAHGDDIGAFNNPDDKGATFWFEVDKD